MSAPHSSAHLNCWLKIELQSNCPALPCLSWFSHRPQKLDLNILAFSINSLTLSIWTRSERESERARVMQRQHCCQQSRNVPCHRYQLGSLAAWQQSCSFVARHSIKPYPGPPHTVHIFNHLCGNQCQLLFHTSDYWIFHMQSIPCIPWNREAFRKYVYVCICVLCFHGGLKSAKLK